MASSFDTSSCCLLGYMIVAVTTTSSAATLPISIKVAGEKLGVPRTSMASPCLWATPALIARQLDKVDMNVYNS